jgi:glycosyltransferase involved in cell wall biosynthesis
MRVLKTVQACEPFREMGGAVVKVRVIAHGLAQRGHEVTVLTADLGLSRINESANQYAASWWGRERLETGVRTIYFTTRARYRALTFNPAIRRFLRENLRHFDVVHIYGMYDLLGPSAAKACRSLGVPYVIEPMGMFRPIVRNIALKRLYHWLWGTRMARRARYVIATSPAEAGEFATEGISRKQIVVRRNGIQMPPSVPSAGTFRARWEIPTRAAMILFLGRVVSKKSPGLLLEAFAQWRKTSPRGANSVLVIAGPEEGDGYYQHLQDVASRLGVKDHVRFTGPLYDNDKWTAYGDADVFVLPSQHENFGNSAGESAAAGVPVILTDRCGIAPLLQGRGGIVIPHDSHKLAEALHAVLDMPGERGRLAAGCVEAARSLSWTAPLDELEALYKSITSQRPRA